MNLEATVRAYVDHLRQQYGISQRDLVAYGSTDARLCRAAHHELAGVATLTRAASPLALILSSTRSVRPSKDERGHAHARGPPFNLEFRKTSPNTPRTPRARGRTHICKQKPRKAFALRGHLVRDIRQIS